MGSVLLFIFLLLSAPINSSRGEVGLRKDLSHDRLGNDLDAEATRAGKFDCLPKDVRLNDVVAYKGVSKQNVTVEETLRKMNARCRNQKLVDAKRREIVFFRLSCWGRPPPDYLEIEEQESEKLKSLKRRYTVIVFGCNPMMSKQSAQNRHRDS